MMQSSYSLKLSAKQQELLEHASVIPEALIAEIVQTNAESLGYMLQSYYSREKVSKVIVIPGSITVDVEDGISLKLEYVMEEFNACSAINTEKKDRMRATIEREAGTLLLKGESWPEL